MDEQHKKELLARWQAVVPSFQREVEAEISPLKQGKNAVFLYGPRRAGKSTIAQRLVRSKEFRYLNFDDPLLPKDMDSSHIEAFCSDCAKGTYIVLDEIQNVSGWEKWVRHAVDTERFHVLVTGSTSKLLSSEFTTSLAGRGTGFLVLPLSFREFTEHYSKKLGDYLNVGGYPEVIKSGNETGRQKLLESYFELAILKDVAARYAVRDIGSLRSLAIFLLTNPGKTVSLRNMKASLNLSFDALRAYLDYLESAFLHFTVPHFAYSLRKSLELPRKTYAYDLGLQSYVSRSFSPDFGRKAENAVAIELKRRGFEVFYWKGGNGREVDFVARKGAEITPVNVCYSENPPAREADSLVEFAGEHKKIKTPVLLTMKREEKTENWRGLEIKERNIEKWLLEKIKGLPPLGLKT
ncbi:ATP-binding protein [Candidatus Micrarchaeota archaeon]|nr:ATP-binding protein [Candidatus Micrarchaeota archaeon]